MGKHRRLRSAGILACVVGSFLAMASAVGADDSLQVIDLSVVQSITPQQAKLGDQIQAHLQIANNGTVTASNVSLTEELNGLVITGITVPPESCTTDQRNVSCHVGPGETIAITLNCWRAARTARTAARRARIRSRIASCAASGTQTAVSRPPRCKTARLAASRLSFFCRSPLLRGIIEGATTMQSSPILVRVR